MTDTPVLAAAHFEAIGRIVRDHAGVDLHSGKEELVRSRVSRRLRALGLAGFEEYLGVLARDQGAELAELLDVITTNKTHFFRESRHFDFIAEQLPRWREEGRPIRIWSAGCSSGEEPYTLAMLLAEQLPAAELRNVRILATDISRPVLQRAQAGLYRAQDLEGLSEARIERHLVTRGERHEVRAELRALVRFARLNLMGPWPMRGPFHAIFCRNVMIYFDRPTRERLVARFHGLLPDGGHLLVGHSESLSGLKHAYEYVAPAVYVK